MKRIYISLFLFMCVVVLSNMCFADSIDSIYEPFEALVSNKSGSDYYENNAERINNSLGKLKYNEKINILEEIEINNNLYGLFNKENKKYLVKIKDLKSTDVLYEDVNKDEYKELYIINSEGVSLRNGPSNNYYSEVALVPKGTRITGYMAKGNEATIKWLYAEYGDNKGWIDCSNLGDVGYIYKQKRNILLVEKTDIYSDYEMTKSVKKLSEYSEISTDSLYSIDFSNFFKSPEVKKGFNIDDDEIRQYNYIITENYEGFIDLKNFGVEETGSYVVDVEGISLYKNPDDTSKIIAQNLPVGTTLDYTYCSKMIHPGGTQFKYGFWAYTEYKGKKGWVQAVEQELIESQKEVVETINSRSNTEIVDNSSKIIILFVLIIVLVLLIAILVIVIKKRKKNN